MYNYFPKTSLEARICLLHAKSYVAQNTSDKVEQLSSLAILQEAVINTYNYVFTAGQGF